jgi:hypothetical protein
MTDDYTRFLVIERLLWETRLSVPSDFSGLSPDAHKEDCEKCAARIAALLDELERMAGIADLPPRYK